MKRRYSFENAPRCTATSKRTKQRCGAPAERGKSVCRFHGARGGAPKGKANGAYKHGLFTAEALKERRLLASLLMASKETVDTVGKNGPRLPVEFSRVSKTRRAAPHLAVSR
jgi:hypothetical protein